MKKKRNNLRDEDLKYLETCGLGGVFTGRIRWIWLRSEVPTEQRRFQCLGVSVSDQSRSSTVHHREKSSILMMWHARALRKKKTSFCSGGLWIGFKATGKCSKQEGLTEHVQRRSHCQSPSLDLCWCWSSPGAAAGQEAGRKVSKDTVEGVRGEWGSWLTPAVADRLDPSPHGPWVVISEMVFDAPFVPWFIRNIDHVIVALQPEPQFHEDTKRWLTTWHSIDSHVSTWCEQINFTPASLLTSRMNFFFLPNNCRCYTMLGIYLFSYNEWTWKCRNYDWGMLWFKFCTLVRCPTNCSHFCGDG